MIINLDVVPAEQIPEIKKAYESATAGNISDWLWLIQQFNILGIGNDRLCGSCPESIKIIKTHIPRLWA